MDKQMKAKHKTEHWDLVFVQNICTQRGKPILIIHTALNNDIPIRNRRHAVEQQPPPWNMNLVIYGIRHISDEMNVT